MLARLVVAIISVLLLAREANSCTTFVVGKKATADGSVMATHSNDGGGTTDPRLVKIPAADYAAGATRPVWASPEDYPRYVGKTRGASAYFTENCQAGPKNCAEFEPIGYIPQVNHTFAYFEETYGVMNEMQVGIAESTCSGVYAARSVDRGGKALLSVDQLSQIAMERASTAREAVAIIGVLAEQYGFYGESDSFEGGSESLIIIDPNEGWVFHILADPTGTSAIWAAARVPDDSVAVVANMFSIREIDLADTANFLGRQDMWEVAKANGLWSEGQAKDFTATFSDGEYAHKYYSGRRMWGVFNLLAPSAALPSEYDNLKADKPYPFAVAIDSPITPQTAMSVMRYWYNGTVYDTAAGLAAGPFATPDRYSGGAGEAQISGSWERTIAIYRSSDSYVVQARSWLPNSIGGIIWYGPAAAHATNYVPIPAGMSYSPTVLEQGWQGVYNLSTAFWTHRIALNIAQIKFDYMIEDIRTLQSQLEAQSQALVNQVSSSSNTPSSANIDSLFEANANAGVQSFHTLINSLLFTYADGDVNYWAAGTFHSASTGYPAWWLEAVGYPDGPPPAATIASSSALRQQAEMNARTLQKAGRDIKRTDHRAVNNMPTLQTQQLADKDTMRACALRCGGVKEDSKYQVCINQCFA